MLVYREVEFTKFGKKRLNLRVAFADKHPNSARWGILVKIP
jgi:hypothetical protein